MITFLLELSFYDSSIFDPLLVYPFNYYIIVFFSFWLLVVFGYNRIILRYKRKKNQPITIAKQQYNERRVEFQRKFTHLLSIIFLLTFYLAPFLFNVIYLYVYLPFPELYDAETMHNVYIIGDLTNFPITVYVIVPLLFLVFFSSLSVQLDSSILFTRNPEYYFPLRDTLEKSTRKEEIGTLSNDIYMVLGYLMTSIIIFYNQPVPQMHLAITTLFAVFFPTIFADFAACVIGKNFGQRKWIFNPKKSYIGTIAGIITTFLTTFWFVGIWLSLIAIILFILTDVYLAKYNLCDNFWFPVLFAISIRIGWGLLTPLVFVPIL
jgi:dolichol kinase